MTIDERARSVVAGVDHSSLSAAAVSYAAWEAARRGVGLRLVNGFVPGATGESGSGPPYDENELVVAAEERLCEVTAGIRSRYPDLPVSVKVVAGSGGKILVEESASAGLVVVGSLGSGGFPGLRLGSVAAQVSQHAHCPVMVIRQSQEDGTVQRGGCVLVGVDGSPSSADALRFGFDEADARGARLVAAHVWSIPGVTARSAGTVWAQSPTKARVQLRDIAERVLAEALSGWEGKYPQVSVERCTAHGDEPARTLLEVADEVAADLVVVGSRQRVGSSSVVMGSVSQALAVHARTSVAVIHPTLASGDRL
jgi:nucleotide-binding universal stress UspA family protein